MAVYYKFKSAKDFDSIPIDGHFISVANLKERIFESKLGRGTGFDLMVANAQTNEEYLDEATLIPKNTSLLVRRVPLQRRMPIIANREEPKTEVNILDHEQPAKTFSMENSSISRYPAQTEGDEFGNDLYAIPEVMPTQSNNTVQHAPDFDKADEDGKIKALIDSSALDWQMQSQDSFGAGRGFGRGMGGRMTGGRGFGRVGFERRTPPQGYICHRCEMPGHYIQHCPTNGDPTYDKKRVKNPTGIPKDMLVVSADGLYALPGGAVASMKPNEAAFDKEVEGLSSTRVVGELPPELHCPMCKEVMKDAVLTSKCCFNSFCDKCIRNRILSNSTCVCGATNILADDLLPNKTVRDTINRILESNNSSTENAGSVLQIHDTESARRDQPKVPSPTISATSKGGRMPSSSMKDSPELKEAANGGQTVFKLPQQSLEKGRTAKAVDLSEVTLESNHDKEPALQGSASHAEEEVQQKLPTGEPGKKKKKKKTLIPVNAAEMQWRASQEFPAENYMMPFAPPTYDPYWGGMQYGMDGYMAPFNCAMPYMGYAPGPFDVPYGGQGYPMPVAPPQRDLSGFGMGFNPAPPMSREEFEARKAPSISREEFEARKADLRRKQEGDRRGQRDWESGRELSNNADISSVKSKSRIIAQETIHNPRMEGTHRMDGNHRIENVHGRERQPREAVEPIRPGKNRAEEGKEVAEHKSSVFSRISFPEGESSKKRKPSSSDANKSANPSYGYKDMESTASYGHHKPLTNGYHDVRKPAIKEEKTRASSGGGGRKGLTMEQDSSDDEEERHFKRRKPARYEPQSVEWEEDARETRISRENTRDPDRGRQHDREYKQERGHRHSHSHSHSHGQR